MKKLLLFVFSFILIGAHDANAAVDTVVVDGFAFTSANLTIEVGDTVVWVCPSESHNVNGTQIDFPNNPEGFTSGAVGSGWTYEFAFTVEGSYSYKCDAHSNMTGTITVNTPSTVVELDLKENAKVYPNPFKETISVRLDRSILESDVNFVIYDVLGNEVKTLNNIAFELTNINTSDLSNGIYIYAFKVGEKTKVSGRLVKD